MEVGRIVLERDRAAAAERSSLMAEVAEAKAAQRRAENLAAAAEEHEQEASAGERLRLRAEATAARKAEAAVRADLDQLRRESSATAASLRDQASAKEKNI